MMEIQISNSEEEEHSGDFTVQNLSPYVLNTD